MTWEAIGPWIVQVFLLTAGAALGGIISWRITKHFDDKNREEKRLEDERRRLFEFRHIMCEAYKEPSDDWRIQFRRYTGGIRLSVTNVSGETVTGLHVEPSTYVDGIGVSSEVDNDALWKWSDATCIVEVDGPDGAYLQEPVVSAKGIPEFSLRNGQTLSVELNGLIDEVDCARIIYDSYLEESPIRPSDVPMLPGRSWPIKREIPIGISPVDSMRDFRPTGYSPFA